MTDRRWSAGDHFEHAGLRFRVMAGRKHAPMGEMDLRLDVYTESAGWVAVPFSLLAIMADVLGENEDVLFPRMLGKKGRGKLEEYLRWATKFGWESAERQLQAEKEAKRMRLFDDNGEPPDESACG